MNRAAGAFQAGGKLPFDRSPGSRLGTNEKACPFALSLSKGKFAPNPKYAIARQNLCAKPINRV
jgi:hypothetical protein